MATQKRRIPGYPHSLHGAAGSGQSQLFAPFCHDPVSWDAWHRDKPSSPHLLLAGLHASPVPSVANLGTGLAHWTPAQVTAWRFRRVLKAAYWDIYPLVEWCIQEARDTFPPPTDGTLYLVGDGSHTPKRGTQNPLAQTGCKSAYPRWFFGMRFVLLIANRDGYRLPVAFRLSRPKSPRAYQPENALFRAMVECFVPPTWAKRDIVEGHAA